MAKGLDQDLFSKLGIEISDEKINIDLKQTKSFFQTLQDTLQQKAQKLQNDLSEGKLDLAEEVGIKLDQEEIKIDLKKTKSFIEELGSKIERFVQEIEKSAQEIQPPKSLEDQRHKSGE